MKKLKNKVRWTVINLCRLALAFTFIFSGTVKLIDPQGTQYKIEDYATAFGLESLVPLFVPICLAVALALLEFMLGINFFFGIRRRMTSIVTLVFLLVMTPLTLYLAISNPVTDCGCFGDALKLTNWQTFGKNVALTLMALVVMRRPRMMTRFITERNQWTISLYSLIFGLVLALYDIHRLPVIDFRPYHVGVDLPKAIMEEWNGIETEPQYLDFSIQTLEGEDITFDWLQQPGYKFLLAAPFLEVADDGAMDQLNDVYDYAQQQGYPFLCLTSSLQESIGRWKDLTGAEYPFAWTDGIVLKTVIRSNPGLLLLKDGVIVNKWPNTNLPSYEELNAPLEKLEMGKPQTSNNLRRALKLLLWFIIPLLLFTSVDRIWVGSKFYKKYKIRHTNQKQQTQEQ